MTDFHNLPSTKIGAIGEQAVKHHLITKGYNVIQMPDDYSHAFDFIIGKDGVARGIAEVKTHAINNNGCFTLKPNILQRYMDAQNTLGFKLYFFYVVRAEGVILYGSLDDWLLEERVSHKEKWPYFEPNLKVWCVPASRFRKVGDIAPHFMDLFKSYDLSK